MHRTFANTLAHEKFNLKIKYLIWTNTGGPQTWHCFNKVFYLTKLKKKNNFSIYDGCSVRMGDENCFNIFYVQGSLALK